ncbi:hypothetical protein, partial [Limnohabitans sp. Bal53]|uniref:hypothetical protein n=1 Tax=Limnohabitans sp. Bal53 TaxID=1977910 RepID=UPI001E2F7074
QPDRLHLEFQRVLGPFPRFTHLVLLELIFNHQLSSTFFGGKVSLTHACLCRADSFIQIVYAITRHQGNPE